MAEYDSVLACSHAALAARRRATIDVAKLRWLFDHRDVIRTEAARWMISQGLEGRALESAKAA